MDELSAAHSHWNKLTAVIAANMPVALVLAAIVFLSAGLHFAQNRTGRFDLLRSSDEYGAANFQQGSEVYPRSATDAHGYRLTVVKPSKRIASLDWTIDEFVYSVVPAGDVIAVSETAYSHSFSNVFELAEKYMPVVGLSTEAVLKAEPDLVLGSSERSADFADILRNAGIPVFRMFVLFTTLDELAENIRLTGYLTGSEAQAESVYRQFRAAIARAESRRPSSWDPPRILGYAGKYSYGSETLFNDIVRAVGGINVGAENGLSGYDTISSEQVLQWNPDWIVTGAGPGQAEEVLQRALADPAIRATAAARKGQILVLENHVFLPISPFTTLILDALSDALYHGAPE